MEAFWQDVGIGAPDIAQWLRVAIRLGAAIALAGVVGFDRERRQQPAGLRTHMLVALGAALFTIVPLEVRGGSTDLARLVQGLAPGIGFLGAGAILKREEHRNVHGLTTAASIWLAAAIGFAAGSGQVGIATMGTVFTYSILVALRRLEGSLPQLPSGKSAPGQHTKSDAAE